MKKIAAILTTFLAGALLSACGGKEPDTPWIGIAPGSDLETVTNRTEYYDLTVESEKLFDMGLDEKNPEEYYSSDIQDRAITVYHLLGTQFASGEPVQLWSEATPEGVDICLYRTDGSREFLVQGLPDEGSYFADGKYSGYADRDRNCYLFRMAPAQVDGEYRSVINITKLLPTGETQYKNALEPGYQFGGVRQTEDGRIYLLLQDYDNFKETLAELDPDTGQLAMEPRMEWDFINGWASSLGAAGTCPGRVSLSGIDSLDAAGQSVTPLLYFDGTSYGLNRNWEIQDFQALKDGTFEILQTAQNGKDCILERLRMEKVEKTPIVVRGFFSQETWLSERVALFNRKNNDYHVVLETCGEGNDPDDFARLTSVQIGAGKGPDILCGEEILHDYISGMLEKGALERLDPYMEASGIREEDYFPLVFAKWRQGEAVYSVTPVMGVSYEEMDADILGNRETPDIEALMDALLAREGNAVYRKGLASGDVMESFLQGSESFWGMVDWQSGSCDFDTPLFGKVLEAARRYGYDEKKAMEPEVTEEIQMAFFFHFNSPAEQEEKGRVSVGTLFDDGCHAESSGWYVMAVNANSANKEGAWEFLAFLLGEDAQYREQPYWPPVHRAAFDKWLDWEIWKLAEQHFENGKQLTPVYYGENISEEKKTAYRQAIEDAKPLPVRTVPILAIILEEAEDYFSGSKSAEEVSKIVNNRVQLYLDERK